MPSVKKRLWIEILLHIVFWAGVFYTLTSLNSSHIHIRLKTRFAVTDQYENTSISSYVYVILIFLAALFTAIYSGYSEKLSCIKMGSAGRQ